MSERSSREPDDNQGLVVVAFGPGQLLAVGVGVGFPAVQVHQESVQAVDVQFGDVVPVDAEVLDRPVGAIGAQDAPFDLVERVAAGEGLGGGSGFSFSDPVAGSRCGLWPGDAAVR